MKKLTVKLAAVAAAALLVTVFLPFTLAEEGTGETAEPMASAEPNAPVEVKDLPIVKPIGGCLPTTRLTCDSMPMPYGATCSCTSTLIEAKCKTCDGDKGQVVKTTCTVYNPCTNPPCDLQSNFTRTAYSCSP